jgi:phosphohistidine phosphatase
MELILWRHAEAQDGAPDLARPLTPRGEEQARKTARWLREHLPRDARLLASPARRTEQTARELARLADMRLHTIELLAPGASAADVESAVQWSCESREPQSGATAVVVGHQPTLGWVASRLLTGRSQYWSIERGCAWWFSTHTHDGATRAILRAVVNPDFL